MVLLMVAKVCLSVSRYAENIHREESGQSEVNEDVVGDDVSLIVESHGC